MNIILFKKRDIPYFTKFRATYNLASHFLKIASENIYCNLNKNFDVPQIVLSDPYLILSVTPYCISYPLYHIIKFINEWLKTLLKVGKIFNISKLIFGPFVDESDSMI